MIKVRKNNLYTKKGADYPKTKEKHKKVTVYDKKNNNFNNIKAFNSFSMSS